MRIFTINVDGRWLQTINKNGSIIRTLDPCKRIRILSRMEADDIARYSAGKVETY